MNYRYEVIVGNIGSVYYGGSFTEAKRLFGEYQSQSIEGYGRAAHESVILLDRGEILMEYDPTPVTETNE